MKRGRFAIILLVVFSAWSQQSEDYPLPQEVRDPTGTGFANTARLKVVLESGDPPPAGTKVDLVCDGKVRSSGSTGSGGNVTLVAVAGDAAVGQLDGTSQPWKRDCRIQVWLKGFEDQQSINRALWHSEIGTIVLRRSGAATEAARKAPPEAQTAWERGRAAANARDWREACAQFERAVKIYPEYAAAWYGLGIAQDELGSPADARKSLARAVNIQPDYPEPYLRLGALAARDNDLQAAARYLREFLRLSPDAKDADAARGILAKIEKQ